MSKGKIAPIRPSIARILKRQIGGFIREYERERDRPVEPVERPEVAKIEETSPGLEHTPMDSPAV